LAGGAPRGTLPVVPDETPKQRRKRIVAFNLRRIRLMRGFSQQALARRVGVDRTHFVKWEGARWEPDPKYIEKLADELGVSQHEFYLEPDKAAA
jgi:ribosome-binding protein aMBF1 (putative translation factor)